MEIDRDGSSRVEASLRIGDSAPLFRARSTFGAANLQQFRGRWLVFFSHPADFTPVCTSEFVAFARAAPLFERLDCDLLALSVDSLPSHLAWVRAIEKAFDIRIPFPVIEDPSMMIGRAYGMIDEHAGDTSAIRAAYVLDPDGIIRAMTWYPMTVGRSVDELLRLVAALKRTAAGDVLTPEGWRPGDDVLEPVDLSNRSSAQDDRADWFCRRKPDR